MSVYWSTHLYTRIHASTPMYMYIHVSIPEYMLVYQRPAMATYDTRMPSRILSTPLLLSAVGNASSGTAKPPWSKYNCKTMRLILTSHSKPTLSYSRESGLIRELMTTTLKPTIRFNAITSSQGVGQCPGIRSTLHTWLNHATKLQFLYLWQRPMCTGFHVLVVLCPGLLLQLSCLPCH